MIESLMAALVAGLGVEADEDVSTLLAPDSDIVYRLDEDGGVIVTVEPRGGDAP